jgi:hypothetical protein
VAAFIVGALLLAEPPAPSFRAARLVSAPSKSHVGEAKRIACGTLTDEERPVCEIQRDENDDVFVLVGGMKIAKRGLPDTAQANTWIMLEPGWFVRDVKGGEAIEVYYERARMH